MESSFIRKPKLAVCATQIKNVGVAAATPMLDIETLFIAGLPSNKLELLDGRVHSCMAFRTRGEAEATFDHWTATVCRWKGSLPETTKGTGLWRSAIGGLELILGLRRIDAWFPFSGSAHYEFCMNFWDPELWPSAGGGETSFGAYQAAQHELLRAFKLDRDQEEGRVCWRTDVVLTESSVLTPELYVFRPGTWEWVGGVGDYLGGVPEVVVEIVTPATRVHDLPDSGRRVSVLARAGVRCYWLVDPGNSTLTTHELDGARYRPVAELRPGDIFRPRFPVGVELDVSRLFAVQWDVPPVLVVGKQPEPDDPGFVVPDEPIGIEHLLLAGHPRRRYEVLDDTAPCTLAFRDPAKARRNFEHWAHEAARIEGVACPLQLGDTFEAGRFRLWHEGNRVHLDLRYSGRLQRDLLEVFCLKGVWETGP